MSPIFRYDDIHSPMNGENGMEFADSYFEGEVREGFFVPSILKKAWAAQLEVVNAIQELCQKHNIQYFAEWGSLLGVVRHGGMIPWDDDFDICMMGQDYNKFLSVIDELPEGYVVHNFHTADTDNMVIKVNNSPTAFVSEEKLEESHGFPYTIGVDIFRLDYLPEKREEQEFYRQLMFLVGSVISLIKMIQRAEEDDLPLMNEKLEEYLKKIEEIYKTKIDRKKSLKEQLYHLVFERLSMIYDERESSEITMIPLWCNDENYRLPKRCFASSISLPFENMKIEVPCGYEELLQKKYGKGYMNPVRTWDSHEYLYFKKYEPYVYVKSPLQCYEYKVTKENIMALEENYNILRQKRRKNVQEQALDFLPLFQEAHENIVHLLQEEQWGVVYALIGECQESAVQLGTLIEQECGENHETVHTLEQYCEELFQTYEYMQYCEEKSETCDVPAIIAKLKYFETVMKNSFEQELRPKKEVVFIPYKTSYWRSMENAWKTAMEEENTEVYVIPAPYYYKDYMGREKKEEPQYEAEGYPPEVKITSYEAYNFETHHPDVIVVQCPYDDFDYAMTLHPFFYSSNLKKYTEQLVYIPALVMDEIMDGDDRAKMTLQYYCNTPGVVNADKVIVQSNQMKKIYVELLTEFAGEDTKEIWERKIVGLESSPIEYEEEKVLPEEWKAIVQKKDGSWKKIILYSTSASALLCYGKKMLTKMQDVFQIFQSCQDDVALVWYPDLKTREMLRKEHPGLWQGYRDLTQHYREEAWGIYDDSQDIKRVVRLCDAGYGDGGVVLNACRCQKKPVMIQNVDT